MKIEPAPVPKECELLPMKIEPAYIVHCTPTRLRIKIPRRRYQDPFFVDLRRQLVQCDGVTRVDANPLTASVLIAHDGTFDLNALHDRCTGIDLGMFELPRPGHAPVRTQLIELDRGVRAVSGGEMNLASAIVKLVLGLITGQLGLHLLELCIEGVIRGLLVDANRPSPIPAAIAAAPQLSAVAAAA